MKRSVINFIGVSLVAFFSFWNPLGFQKMKKDTYEIVAGFGFNRRIKPPPKRKQKFTKRKKNAQNTVAP